MGGWMFLLIFTGSYATIKAACSDFQEVLCSAQRCGIIGDSATLKDGRNISCRVTYIEDDDIPRINPSTESALPPDFADVSCYTVFSKNLDEDKAALNVTWGNREEYIRKGLVTGYFLDVGMQTYHVSLHIDGESKGKETEVSPCIKFIYNCYGQKGYLNAGRTVRILVRPIPRSKRYSKTSNVKEIRFTVPEASKCLNPQTPTVTSGRVAYHTTTAYSLPQYEPKKISNFSSWMYIVGLVLVGSVVLIMIVIGCRCIKRRRSEGDNSRDVEATRLKNLSKSILVLAKRTRTEDCEKCHNIATRLRNSHQVTVICNFENAKEIVYQQNPMSWWDKTLLTVDTVIFFNGVQVLRQSRQRQANGEIRDQNTMCEFEFTIDHFGRFGFEQKKIIFLEDEPGDLSYIEELYLKNCSGFLYKEPYSDGDPLYEELFGRSSVEGNSRNRTRHEMHIAASRTEGVLVTESTF